MNRRPSHHGTVVAYLALFTALGGSAWALVGVEPGPGPQQTQPLVVWAKVSSSGSLQAENGASSASRANAGDYRVTFERSIRRCALTATHQASTSTTSYEYIGAIAAIPLSSTKVRVVTYNQNSGPVSGDFYLVANCKSTAVTSPPSGEGETESGSETNMEGSSSSAMWAKVSSGGSLQANSRVSSASRAGAGDYRVTFEDSIEGCALTATHQASTSTTSYEYIGAISVSRLSDTKARVVTYNQNSGPVSADFYVVANC